VDSLPPRLKDLNKVLVWLKADGITQDTAERWMIAHGVTPEHVRTAQKHPYTGPVRTRQQQEANFRDLPQVLQMLAGSHLDPQAVGHMLDEQGIPRDHVNATIRQITGGRIGGRRSNRRYDF